MQTSKANMICSQRLSRRLRNRYAKTLRFFPSVLFLKNCALSSSSKYELLLHVNIMQLGRGSIINILCEQSAIG